MKMKLIASAVLAAVLLTGCGVVDKRSTVLECNREGITIIKLYKKDFVSMGENIIKPENLRISQIYSYNGEIFRCVPTVSD